MRLSAIAAEIGSPPPQSDPEISDLCYDSGDVAPGCVFFCIPGERADGHDFASVAVDRGASALVVERVLPLAVPQLVVGSSRRAMASLSAPFFRYPSRELQLVGLTGTNGKTTTAFMIDSIFRAAGEPGALIGTVAVRIGKEEVPGVRTTPEAPDLQRLLRKMVTTGATRAVMEATSEGIAKERLVGTSFVAAGFTNLSQDHLNFHGTMEEYYAAKRRLFDPEYSRLAVVNADDEYGRRLASEVEIDCLTYSAASGGDLCASQIESGLEGSRFRVDGLGLGFEVSLRMPGDFNVSNALLATACAHVCGIGADVIKEGLESLAGVPGRFERVIAGQPFEVVVDYAHTPDSLRHALKLARASSSGRVIAVFGCGGDRDQSKRSQMGLVAASAADRVIATSDNPRSEDPLAILREIEEGLRSAGGAAYVIEPDRRAAIALAISQADPGDIIVIAGKGHETGQEIAGTTLPFDDRLVAEELLRRRAVEAEVAGA